MFSWKKLIGGFAFWQGDKAGKLIFYTILLVIGGFIIWSAFIKPTNNKIQEVDNTLRAEIIQIKNFNTGPVQEIKDKWFTPFVEAYGDVNNDKEQRIGIKCGIRLEF